MPVLTLSIAAAYNNKDKKIVSYGEIIKLVFEIKNYLKSFKNRKNSMYLLDRRIS